MQAVSKWYFFNCQKQKIASLNSPKTGMMSESWSFFPFFLLGWPAAVVLQNQWPHFGMSIRPPLPGGNILKFAALVSSAPFISLLLECGPALCWGPKSRYHHQHFTQEGNLRHTWASLNFESKTSHGARESSFRVPDSGGNSAILILPNKPPIKIYTVDPCRIGQSFIDWTTVVVKLSESWHFAQSTKSTGRLFLLEFLACFLHKFLKIIF